MVRAHLIVDLGDDLSLVVILRRGEPDVAARVAWSAGSCCAMFIAAGLIQAGSMRLFTNGARSVTCWPLLHAGEVKAVKSPASMAAVGTLLRKSAGVVRTNVP